MANLSLSLRYSILKRDRFRCTYCGARAGDVELEVDHVRPRSMNGSDRRSNLVAACRPCNQGKSATPLDAEARTYAQPGVAARALLDLARSVRAATEMAKYAKGVGIDRTHEMSSQSIAPHVIHDTLTESIAALCRAMPEAAAQSELTEDERYWSGRKAWGFLLFDE